MVAKFVSFLALVATAAGSANFNSFAYDVADPYTGDFKSQVESRYGNQVAGQYSLLESDGTKRTVDYSAGANGFNAIVRKDPALIAAPLVAKTIATPLIAKTIAAPLIAKTLASPYVAAPWAAPIAAPLAYSSPLAYSGYPYGHAKLGLAYGGLYHY